MIYIINRTLLYDTVQSSITVIDDRGEGKDFIALTAVTNSLLATLLKHQGTLITRNALLEMVWEDSVHEGSVHTLTQYLSNLRKLFREYIPDIEAILTVPRQGYCLSPDVLVDIILDENSQETTPENGLTINHKNSTDAIIKRTPIWVIVIFCFASSALVSYNAYLSSHNDYPIQSITLITEYQDCPVYQLKNHIYEQRNKLFLKRFTQILERYKLTCEPYTKFYLNMARGAEVGLPGNMMLTRCTENPAKPNICVTYQYSRWQEEK